MSQELRDLMVRTAESAPTVRVDPGTWRAARRARRRERIVAPLAAAVALVGIAAVAWPGPSALLGADRADPVAGALEPAMPSRVYTVPDHLDGLSAVDRMPQEGTRAIGVTAVAFTTLGYAPYAVSAVDGTYHLLDLPGYDVMAGFRFEDGSLALSPDGRRLAYTWNNAEAQGDGAEDRYVPSGVRIVDLTTGEVESHQEREGYGVFSHGLSWSPNGRYLAFNTQIANVSQSGTSGRRNFFVERLDTETGERLKAGAPGSDSPPTVTDEGTVVTGNGLNLWTWRPDQGTTRIDLSESARFRGSVVAVGAMAGSEQVLVSAGLEYSRLYLGRPDSPRSFRRLTSGQRWLLPAGAVDGDRQAVLEQTYHRTALWTSGSANPSSADLVTFEEGAGPHYSFATSLLRRPTRDFPAPDWPMSADQKLLIGGLAAAGLLGLVGWLRHRLRRRRTVTRLADQA
jgi:hypothetical protein